MANNNNNTNNTTKIWYRIKFRNSTNFYYIIHLFLLKVNICSFVLISGGGFNAFYIFCMLFVCIYAVLTPFLCVFLMFLWVFYCSFGTFWGSFELVYFVVMACALFDACQQKNIKTPKKRQEKSVVSSQKGYNY